MIKPLELMIIDCFWSFKRFWVGACEIRSRALTLLWRAKWIRYNEIELQYRSGFFHSFDSRNIVPRMLSDFSFQSRIGSCSPCLSYELQRLCWRDISFIFEYWTTNWQSGNARIDKPGCFTDTVIGDDFLSLKLLASFLTLVSEEDMP